MPGGVDTSGLSFGTVYTISCVSSCLSETVTFPLDILKTRVQAEKVVVKDVAGYQAWVKQIAQDIVHPEAGGYLNLFRGLTPACIRHLVYSGSRLPLYEVMREDVLGREMDGSFPLWKAVIAGIFSGGFAQFLSSPTDLVKVRMQMERKRAMAGEAVMYRGTWHCFTSVFQEGGIRGLWRGWVPNCQRAALVQLGDLTTYDTAKQHLIRDFGWKDGSGLHAASSMCAGMAAAVMGTPADVIKTRMMNQPHEPVTGRGMLYHSSWHCLKLTVKEEGLLALYRGFLLNYMRMAPWSLTFFITFEQMRRSLGLSSF